MGQPKQIPRNALAIKFKNAGLSLTNKSFVGERGQILWLRCKFGLECKLQYEKLAEHYVGKGRDQRSFKLKSRDHDLGRVFIR